MVERKRKSFFRTYANHLNCRRPDMQNHMKQITADVMFSLIAEEIKVEHIHTCV